MGVAVSPLRPSSTAQDFGGVDMKTGNECRGTLVGLVCGPDPEWKLFDALPGELEAAGRADLAASWTAKSHGNRRKMAYAFFFGADTLGAELPGEEEKKPQQMHA